MIMKAATIRQPPFDYKKTKERKKIMHKEEMYIPDVGFKEEFFRYDNRLNRKRFIIRHAKLWLISFIIGIAAGFILSFLDAQDSIRLVGTIVSLPFSIAGIMVNIRRLHDIGKSGWWLLLVFIPFVNLLFVLALFLIKGTDGPNQFGPDPLEVEDDDYEEDDDDDE